MANKRNAWLTGCGIGCGIVLLLGILVIVGSFAFVRDTMRGFDGALETRQQLEERFGGPHNYDPQPSGAIPAERIELFLRARERMEPARARMSAAIDPINISDERAQELEEGSFWEKLSFVGGTTKHVLDLPAAMGDLIEARNLALLENGMGLGEYTYIYVLAYHSWPSESITGEARPARRLSSRVQRNLTDMLRHQLGAFDRAADPALPEEWRERLVAEIDAMHNDPFRVPWQDGLPEPIDASLRPFRERLEAAHDPQTDEFELARPRKEGMTIHSE